MLVDTRRDLRAAFGILHRAEGVDLSAMFIVDSERLRTGTIRHGQRSVGGARCGEVLQVLEAPLTDQLYPCNWRKMRSNVDCENELRVEDGRGHAIR